MELRATKGVINYTDNCIGNYIGNYMYLCWLDWKIRAEVQMTGDHYSFGCVLRWCTYFRVLYLHVLHVARMALNLFQLFHYSISVY